MPEYTSRGSYLWQQNLPYALRSFMQIREGRKRQKIYALSDSLQQMISAGVEPTDPRVRSALSELERVSPESAVGLRAIFESEDYLDKINERRAALSESERQREAQSSLDQMLASLSQQQQQTGMAAGLGAAGFPGMAQDVRPQQPVMGQQQMVDMALQSLIPEHLRRIQPQDLGMLPPPTPTFDPRRLPGKEYAGHYFEQLGPQAQEYFTEQRKISMRPTTATRTIEEWVERGYVKPEDAPRLARIKGGLEPRAGRPRGAGARSPEEIKEDRIYKRAWQQFTREHDAWVKKYGDEPEAAESAGEPEPDFYKDYLNPMMEKAGLKIPAAVDVPRVREKLLAVARKWPPDEHGTDWEAWAIGEYEKLLREGVSAEDAYQEIVDAYTEALKSAG